MSKRTLPAPGSVFRMVSDGGSIVYMVTVEKARDHVNAIRIPGGGDSAIDHARGRVWIPVGDDSAIYLSGSHVITVMTLREYRMAMMNERNEANRAAAGV